MEFHALTSRGAFLILRTDDPTPLAAPGEYAQGRAEGNPGPVEVAGSGENAVLAGQVD